MTETELLVEELRVADALLVERNKVLNAIPPCPAHGAQCVPHALAWIEMAKSIVAAAQTFQKETEHYGD